MSLVKKGAALLMVATMALSSAACSNSKTEGKPEAQAKVAPVEKNGDKTVIRFWHAMGGKIQGVLDGLVADYNKSQNKYEIKAEFQGTYEESLTKFKTMSATKEAPALVQSSEITTKYMIDSKKITPIDSWIKKDKYDTSKLEKAITNYYSVDGKMYSMPFNSSTPVLIYNKDAFAKAGLDQRKLRKRMRNYKKQRKS